MGAAQSGAGRNSRSLFVGGSRFYLASQAARLDAPNFRRDKETLALARTGSGAGETAPSADSIPRETNRSFAIALHAESNDRRGTASPETRNRGWARCENPRW